MTRGMHRAVSALALALPLGGWLAVTLEPRPAALRVETDDLGPESPVDPGRSDRSPGEGERPAPDDAPLALLYELRIDAPPLRAERPAVTRAGSGRAFTFTLPRRIIATLRIEVSPRSDPLRVARLVLVDTGGHAIRAVPGAALEPGAELTLEPTPSGVAVLAARGGVPAQARIPVLYPLFPPGPALCCLQAWLLGLFAIAAATLAATRSPWTLALLARPWLVRSVAAAVSLPALWMVVRMAVDSPLGPHPDELGHIPAAAYYIDRWLPSPVGDPSLEPTVMGLWARSYLFYPDFVYFLAGKTAGQVGAPLHLALRLFNVALLAAVLGAGIWLAPRHPALVLAAGLTPQAWYVFSYFNSDAFPLALALAIAGVLAARIDEPRPADALPRRGPAVVLGVLLGLLLLSKVNYVVFAAYAAAVLASPLPELARGTRRGALGRVGLVAGVALAIFLVRWGYGEAINGFDMQARVEAFVEERADPSFRHSRLQAPDSYPGLYLREKGRSLASLFTERDWHGLTYRSFFGLYGFMDTPAPRSFYRLTVVLVLVLLGAGAVTAWRRADARGRRVLVLSAVTAALVVAQSIARSWTFDFQPQGRYLLPVLPILVVALGPALRRLQPAARAVVLFALYGLSLWSFVAVALAGLLA